ncbi:MAG: hypothetical protein EOO75_00680, partial [Myxococcales bacterium]
MTFGKNWAGVVLAVALVGCGGDDDKGQGAEAAGGNQPGSSSDVAPPVNLTTAPGSVCGEPGAAPGEFAASCADDQKLVTLEDGQQNAYCTDKRFGTFFFVNLSIGRNLFFCERPGQASWFTFGEDYSHVVVVQSKGVAQPFAVGPGHTYRCENTFTVDAKKPLPLRTELCGGFQMAEVGDSPKVTKDGRTLALIPLTGASAPVPDPDPDSCTRLKEKCCVNEPTPDEQETCEMIADELEFQGSQQGCQKRIDSGLHTCSVEY